MFCVIYLALLHNDLAILLRYLLSTWEISRPVAQFILFLHFSLFARTNKKNGDVVALQSMDPTVEAPATMSFTVPDGATELTPYEWWYVF